MFAFDMSLYTSHMVLFAAEPSVWLWVVGALVLWAVIFRRPRRKKDGVCRKRRGFPWRAAVLVVLIVVAWKKFGTHSNWSVDWDLDDEIRSLQAATGIGGFLPIEKKDLWALRHEDPEKTRDEVKRRTPRSASKRAVRDDVGKSGRFIAKSNTDGSKEASVALDDVVSPHVARSVTQARELADRAVEQARSIAAKTAHNVAAIKALKALKFDEADDDDVADKKVTEKTTDAPSTVSVTAVAPSPPDPPAAPEPPAVPAARTEVAVKATADRVESSAEIVAVEAAEQPKAFVFPGAPTPKRTANSEHVASSVTSVRKESEPLKPVSEARPVWLDQPGGRDGDIYYETVMVERYATAAEAEDALAEELQARTRAYVDRYLGAGASKLFTVPPAYIHDRLVRDRYKETVESSVGPMVNAYAQLAFDHRARAQLQRMQRDAQIEHRLLEVAGGAAAVMLVLGAVFGYLKLDTLTRGYYTRRLQLAAGVVILTVAAGTLYVVRSKMHDVPSQESPASAPSTAVRVLPIDAAQLPAS
jgi:hypothetical protein